MRVVKAESASPIDLGRWDEKNVTRVEFNLTPYINLYGEGVPQLTVKKPGDPLEYAAPVEREGNVAVWVVGREWLTKDGQGKCQLFWHVTETGGVAKSPEYKLKVSEAMGMSDETAKEPYAGYLAQVQAAGVQAQDGAKRAEEAARSVEGAGEEAERATLAANAAEQAKTDAQKAATSAGNAAQASSNSALAADRRAGDAERAAREAEGYTSHPPLHGENGNWWLWDGEDYADSGKSYMGEPGADGKDGAPGADGKDGADGAPGKDGADGAPGKDGADGAPGKDGADGKTPQRGVDYYTHEDVEAIVADATKRVEASFGGTYELVEEITTTEDLTRIDRAAWPDGTPYSFKAMYITVAAPAGAGSGNLNSYVFHETKIINVITTNGSINTGTRYTNYTCFPMWGRWEGLAAITSGEWGAGYNHQVQAIPRMVADYPFIDGVRLLAVTSDVPLPAGTIIRIYGVRA